MVYKSLNGLAPNYLRSKFTYRSNVSSYSLRGTNDNLTIPLPHTNFMKNSFSYSGSVLWNSLPNIELRQANSRQVQGWLQTTLLKIYLHGTYVKQALSLKRICDNFNAL